MKHHDAIRAVQDIAGEKVVLRPVRAEDAGEVVAACRESEAELLRFMPWKNEKESDYTAFVERSARDRAEGRTLNFTIYRKGDGSLLGGIGLHHVDPFSPVAEVGYWLRSSATGNGHATDALRALMRWCEGEGGFARLNANAARENVASQRVLIRCGFVEEGFRPRGALVHGVWHDMLLFGRVASCDVQSDPCPRSSTNAGT